MQNKNNHSGHGRGVKAFVQRHADEVTGVISGWDRLRLQGSLRALYLPELMQEYLWRAQVLWKDFKHHVTEVTAHIRDAATVLAEDAGRPLLYLRSSALRKETLIEQIRARDHIEKGLIAVLSVVEPCRTWFVRGERATHRLRLELGWGRCIHLYFYLVHPLLGLMHLRVQTWFPFLVHVCLNGREWLARQLQAEGLGFTRADNCFTALQDPVRAQALLEAQVRTPFAPLLDPLIATYHPTHELIHAILPVDYYWTVAESEHATDVMFRDRTSLAAIYPALVQHSTMSFGAEQVLRFLGRAQPGQSEVSTKRRRRVEGVCVKHWVNKNSLKLYDKGSALRSEVTINEPAEFKVCRASERDPRGPKAERQLRRSVADLPRRAQVSRAASDRHLEALAAVACDTPLAEALAPVCRRIVRDGQSYRALRPFDPLDQALLRAISHAEHTLHGLRNRDLRTALRGLVPAGLTEKQLAARASRLLRWLRAHGLLAKVARTQRYRVTAKGREIATAVLAAGAASTPQLTCLAA